MLLKNRAGIYPEQTGASHIADRTFTFLSTWEQSTLTPIIYYSRSVRINDNSNQCSAALSISLSTTHYNYYYAGRSKNREAAQAISISYKLISIYKKTRGTKVYYAPQNA